MPTFEFHIRQKHPGKHPPGLQVRPGYLLSVKAETVDEASISYSVISTSTGKSIRLKVSKKYGNQGKNRWAPSF